MSLTWDEFVSGWAKSHDGYDMRQAPAATRAVLRFGYRAGGVMARLGVRPASLMIISAMASITVPLFATMHGAWPALAAVAVAVSLFADALSGSLTVFNGATTRLGNFSQALVERLAEVCWLIAFSALGVRPGLVFGCAALVWAQEYIRAKAGGTMTRPALTSTVGDRPARLWLTLAALLLAAIADPVGVDLAAGISTLVLLIWMALAVVGVFQLLTIVRKTLA
jgi:CDP-diacylglycerol--glycerol-3-phosphate 3-phosphatidyltransferase